MKPNTRRAIFSFMFVLSVINFNRLQGNENIRNIQFLSIFVMGMFGGLFIKEIIDLIKSKQENNSL